MKINPIKLPDSYARQLKKFYLVMKLSWLMILALCLQSAASVWSQNTSMSMKMEQTSLQELFNTIESKSGYRFFYNNDDVDVSQKVSIDVSNKPIGDILTQAFKDLPYSFREVANKLILVERSVNQMGATGSQQQKSITGKVTDSTGSPLPGVSILIKGTTQGTISDSNGNYSLSNVPGNAILQFSFVGMKQQEILVAGKTYVNVTLTEESIGIEEVVAVGYGTQKKASLTGAVDVIKGAELQNRASANVGTLLTGVSPNLNIGVTMRGGEPGSGNNFSIRGLGSLSEVNGKSGGSPLILVDGFEMNINNLDPETVESVSILKDAASSAIYGSRAPFGVVLITTKKGKKGKASVTYSNNIAFASPINLPKWQSSLRYVTAYNQALKNSGQPDKFSAAQIDRIKRHMEGTYTPEYDTINPPGDLWAMRHQGNANYEWFDEYFKDVTVNQKHNINITGGDEKTQYYVSTGLYDQGGAYNYGEEYYRRYNILTNITSQVTPWLSLNVNSKFANLKSIHPISRTGGIDPDRNFIMSEIIKFFPTTPKKLVTGELANVYALILENGGSSTENANDLSVNLGGELEPVKGWKTNFQYNYNYAGSKYTNLLERAMALNARGQYLSYSWAPPGGSFDQYWNMNNFKTINLYTTYEKTISNHSFYGQIGYENEYRYYSSLSGSRTGIITYDVPSFSTATGPNTLDDNMSHWSTEGFFGRIRYGYMEKYLFEANGRYSGSSKFAEGKRWGFFPSVSAGYVISKEPFWESLESYVNFLKIRGTYGSLGNQNVDNYQYLSIIPINTEVDWILNNQRPNYATIPGIISPTLTWETVNTLNIGVDVNFFQNRLKINFDKYKRNTLNMFGPATILPSFLGTNPPKENNAELETKGYEFIAEWNDRVNNDFSYSAKVTLSDSRTFITKYLNTTGLIDEFYEGKEYGEIWGYETAGIIQSADEVIPDQSDIYNRWGPGDIKYADLTGEGKVDDGKRTLDDHGDLKVIGNRTPRYMIGASGSVTWKNFDFTFFGQGLLRRNLVVGQYDNMMWGVGTQGNNGGAFYQGHDDYWRPADETNLFGPNTDAYYAKPYVTNETLKNQVPQSRYTLNTGYFRLKNVRLGYTVPSGLTSKMHLQKIHVYLSGENLFTIDDLPPHMDPETANASPNDWRTGGRTLGAIYPLSRSVSVGLNVTF